MQPLVQPLLQRERERELPPIRLPAFAAVHSCLRLLPAQAQPNLQPLYQGLRAADSLDDADRAVSALEPVVRFCLDNPASSSSDLKQQAQLHAAGGAGSFLAAQLGLLGNSGFLSLLQPGQSQQPQSLPSQARQAAGGQWSELPCFKCGRSGHFYQGCREAFDINGRAVREGALEFASQSFKDRIGLPYGRGRAK